MIKSVYLFGILLFSFFSCNANIEQKTVSDLNFTVVTGAENANEFDAIAADHILALIFGSKKDQDRSFDFFYKNWSATFIAPLLDVIRVTHQTVLPKKIRKLLVDKVGDVDLKNFGTAHEWLWDREANYSPEYFRVKAKLYSLIDEKFYKYFHERNDQIDIRLDEVMWGGVLQDGIPPLRGPDMIEAHEADYLDDDNVVFGFYINGVAKAYPKRVLAWHEFFIDDFDGVEIAGVYCTLCGSVIPYETTVDGVRYELGTSGFLYRSNKLMYDKKTQSLWNTIEGRPVIGPLVGKGIELNVRSVVTTTWSEWRDQHPDTKVLSLNTGHRRDYGEGVAYNQYFATDELMFPVPDMDKRLKNKDEVFVLRTDGFESDPLAVAVKYFKKNKFYQTEVAGNSFVLVRSRTGIRAYHNEENLKFDYKNGKLLDHLGNEYTSNEDELTSPNKVLKRASSHHTFWFAWRNMYPETRLIK